jgi:hypothetical protein
MKIVYRIVLKKNLMNEFLKLKKNSRAFILIPKGPLVPTGDKPVLGCVV